ncbi:MAG: HD domain-containing protein [Clostridiales bacterium]|nr:HD domain-containing protein [Clostridiales bacterium]
MEKAGNTGAGGIYASGMGNGKPDIGSIYTGGISADCIGAGGMGAGGALADVFRDPVLSHMLSYVEERLRPVDKLAKSGASFPFRSRYMHSVRVLGWALRIHAAMGGGAAARARDGGACAGAEAPATGTYPVAPAGTGAGAATAGTDPARLQPSDGIPHSLAVAAIFHDIGYAACGAGRPESALCHAKFSEEMLAEYALSRGLYAGRQGRRQLGEIASIIAVHSDKRLSNAVLTAEQQILMDADLLDESGAMRFAWICFCEAGKGKYDYASAYAHMREHVGQAEKELALFHTEAGRAFGNAMLGYIRAFADGLASELQLQ